MTLSSCCTLELVEERQVVGGEWAPLWARSEMAERNLRTEVLELRAEVAQLRARLLAAEGAQQELRAEVVAFHAHLQRSMRSMHADLEAPLRHALQRQAVAAVAEEVGRQRAEDLAVAEMAAED